MHFPLLSRLTPSGQELQKIFGLLHTILFLQFRIIHPQQLSEVLIEPILPSFHKTRQPTSTLPCAMPQREDTVSPQMPHLEHYSCSKQETMPTLDHLAFKHFIQYLSAMIEYLAITLDSQYSQILHIIL